MDKTSFSYRSFFKQGPIMVILPHEDDEINLAGTVIYGARQEGIPVICVFVTNGDWLYAASVRLREAVHALHVLGVPEEDVIFLGYPDGGVEGERSVFLHGKDKIVNARGHKETYGDDQHPDFRTKESGEAHTYRWENMLSDLKAVILKYKPSCIIGTDFDRHADHRMCSIALETIIGEILNDRHIDYCPDVWKGFAYSTAFESLPDFSEINLRSTKINRNVLWNTQIETDAPAYRWTERVRLPVAAACRAHKLSHNVLYRALCCHMSQWAGERAERIINGDQIFWRRRTDNLIHRGKVTVSSGNSGYLHDFLLMNSLHIGDLHPAMEDYLWIPDQEDREKWCQCTFDTPQTVDSMRVYGNIDDTGRILQGRAVFSNGYVCDIGPLALHGQATDIPMERQERIRWIRIQILQEDGIAGIAEWEIFGHKEKVFPVLHILCNDEFAYDWYIDDPKQIPKLSSYMYGSRSKVRWHWNGKESTLIDIQKNCIDLKYQACIRAELEDDPAVWAEVIIHPCNMPKKIQHALENFQNKLTMRIDKWKHKSAHHRLKEQGKKLDR